MFGCVTFIALLTINDGILFNSMFYEHYLWSLFCFLVFLVLICTNVYYNGVGWLLLGF